MLTKVELIPLIDLPVDPPGAMTPIRDCTSRESLDAVIDQCAELASEYGWTAYSTGGVMLRVDEVTYVQPMCCVDLRDGMADWIQFVDEQPSGWTSIWAGHPAVLARVVDSQVQISPQSDDFGTPVPVAVKFDAQLLRPVLAYAREEIELFALRLADRMAARSLNDPVKTARSVAGLDDLPSPLQP